MPKNLFVNLHTHSFYSILSGTLSPKNILELAQSHEAPGVAITDSGVGYGILDFFEASAKFEGVKPIAGAEVFLTLDSRFERRAGIDGKEGHIVLLAQNTQGYENLVKILSLSQLEGFYYKPRADIELLKKYSKGLVCLTGTSGGVFGRLWRDFGEEKALGFLAEIQSIYGHENVFLEIVARHFEEQINFNKWVGDLNLNSEFVVTSDARYADPKGEEAADTLYCIGKNQLVSDPNRFKFLEKNWFKSWDEITKELDYLDSTLLEQARLNTLKICEGIDFEMVFDQSLLPNFETDDGSSTADKLKGLCLEAIKKKYKTDDQKTEAKERLAYELNVVGKMGFESYFLIVADFINFAKENGISVGPGRGSAAGSIISYLLGITNIDPLEYELLFERFLNPERISMPDIDIDFSDERRDEVLQYVIEKYGTEKVSKVCTFGTLAAKAALKDVGRAHGIEFGLMNAMTKLLPNKPGFTLDDAKKVKEFTDFVDKNPQLKKIFEVGQQLEGCVRHVSVHACAVIIGKSDLTNYTPLQWAPGTEAIKITQFPYQQLEHLGLLKMDFLGLKNLTVLEKTIQNIYNTEGIELDLNTIELKDTKTFAMLSEGETTGVFQFESAGMRRYLRDLRPTELEDLVAMNALYRPGPMEYIPQYIQGKHKPETVEYLHEDLKPILNKTYGIAVYQEQVLRIAQEFAGFSLGEADILRKAIGKKIASILAEQREKFIKGATEKKYDKKLAIKIFDEIVVPFSGYGFNRSHAVCYARIAYETAYLRANYPVEFMAAMMTTDRNNTDRIVLEMNECQLMGIEVLPPSVNESGSHFTVIKPVESGQEVLVENKEIQHSKKIRFGLTAIKGLGEETVNQIIFERNATGAFESLQDFAKRVPAKLMNKKTLEALAFSGAFDAFGDRKGIVDSLDDLAKFARDYQEKQDSGQMGLFGGADESAIEFSVRNTKATKEDILKWERESLGLFVSDHPLRGLNQYFEKYGSLIGALNEAEDAGKRRTLHGLVTNVKKIITKSGKNMALLEIEDTSGKIECAIFPKMYDSILPDIFNIDAFVRIRGKIEDRNGKLNCIVDEAKLGNLKDVQGNKHLFEAKDDKSHGVSVPPVDEIFVIDIPQSTLKSQVEALKILLKENEDTSNDGIKVQVKFSTQVVNLPFRVRKTKFLEDNIAYILTS